jgi:hypothetical protein
VVLPTVHAALSEQVASISPDAGSDSKEHYAISANNRSFWPELPLRANIVSRNSNGSVAHVIKDKNPMLQIRASTPSYAVFRQLNRQ